MTTSISMSSNKPYLIRAFYDWIVDNSLTPYLIVNAHSPGVEVPLEHVNEGRIILNISPKACRDLHLENHKIFFTARFSGVVTEIFLHPGAVLAIYAKENGRGMEFEEEDDGGFPPESMSPEDKKGKGNRSKPKLKLVK